VRVTTRPSAPGSQPDCRGSSPLATCPTGRARSPLRRDAFNAYSRRSAVCRATLRLRGRVSLGRHLHWRVLKGDKPADLRVPAMSHRSVSEIAFATGFKAPSHFNCVDRALSTHRARGTRRARLGRMMVGRGRAGVTVLMAHVFKMLTSDRRPPSVLARRSHYDFRQDRPLLHFGDAALRRMCPARRHVAQSGRQDPLSRPTKDQSLFVGTSSVGMSAAVAANRRSRLCSEMPQIRGEAIISTGDGAERS
jgi:hypothetical protein